MQNLMIFLLQLSMIAAALLASFWVLHAIAVMTVDSYGISGTAVALAIIYGVALMMETGERRVLQLDGRLRVWTYECA
jgi:hypothetical protein